MCGRACVCVCVCVCSFTYFDKLRISLQPEAQLVSLPKTGSSYVTPNLGSPSQNSSPFRHGRMYAEMRIHTKSRQDIFAKTMQRYMWNLALLCTVSTYCLDNLTWYKVWPHGVDIVQILVAFDIPQMAFHFAARCDCFEMLHGVCLSST